MDCIAVVQAFCLAVAARRRRRAARDEACRAARTVLTQVTLDLERAVDADTAPGVVSPLR
jgi:hypothetical protein